MFLDVLAKLMRLVNPTSSSECLDDSTVRSLRDLVCTDLLLAEADARGHGIVPELALACDRMSLSDELLDRLF